MATAIATRCPRCGAATQQARPGPPPLCIECDPTAAELLERREKDRAEAYQHSLRRPRKKETR